MTTPISAQVAAIKAQFNGCFGCGMHNPIGLQLNEFLVDGESVSCRWEPRPDYQSFPEILHGGIVTAALDETMAWTAMLLTGYLVVTGTMELRFRRPAPGGGTYTLTGNLDEHRGKRIMLSSSMRLADDREVASAKAMFITTERVLPGTT